MTVVTDSSVVTLKILRRLIDELWKKIIIKTKKVYINEINSIPGSLAFYLWDAKDMELESGTIDCIWNGFTMNGREDDYTWTEPYMNNTQVFVVNAESGIKTLAELTGKTVEVQADSSAEAALKDMPELMDTFGTMQTTPDYNTAFMDLEMGAVDAIAMDVVVARYQIEQRQNGCIILEESIASEEYGIGFKKGNEELRDKVQKALNEMAADGTMKKISEKWFGEDITTVGK